MTKKEIEEQYVDPDSDLAKLGHKSFIKNEIKITRKNKKIAEDLKKKKRIIIYHCYKRNFKTIKKRKRNSNKTK
ncbi:MAG: hypothetical protein WCL51_01530 [Bacteroidota bacterium]